jgi:hypothetical protein
MGQLGMGKMFRMMAGNSASVEAVKASLDQEIRSVSINDNSLLIGLADHVLQLTDQAQSCCERRYMVCDDKLDNFIGGTLLDLSVEDAPSTGNRDECAVHDVQFLHVKTSNGSFTVSNHNEHNGYYGGFSIEASITRGRRRNDV